MKYIKIAAITLLIQSCQPMTTQDDTQQRLDDLTKRVERLENDYLKDRATLSLILGMNGENQDAIKTLEDSLILLQTELVQQASQQVITAIIDPCGDNTKVIDEVYFVTNKGQVLASFTDSKGTRLSILQPGKYVTTDGSACQFEIDSKGNVSNSNVYY